MRYHYEFLGPETFQHFAQALIVARHPDTQCLPVGQPDGGRDAFEYLFDSNKDGFVIFQVKFSKDPGSKDERDVVEELIKTEKKKVDKLIERGAEQYYLITNVKGTAHLDAGSIDKTNKALTDAFEITAIAGNNDSRVGNYWINCCADALPARVFTQPGPEAVMTSLSWSRISRLPFIDAGKVSDNLTGRSLDAAAANRRPEGPIRRP